MPDFDSAELTTRERYFLLSSIVVPRPIAWVGSRSAAGAHNLAPHSFFNMMASEPGIVHFTSLGVKDTLRNVRETGEFTISIVSEDLLEAMNLTAADFPEGVDEFEWAGVPKQQGTTVDVPYVATAPAAIECTLRTVLSMGNGHMVFGDVTRVHVRDDLWVDGRVDAEALRALGRLSGSNYAMDATVHALKRPAWADLEDGGPAASG